MNVNVTTTATFQIKPHASSDKLVIFFSATGAKPRRFNFEKDGRQLPCHCIYINNGENEWYQNGVPGMGASIEETVATLRLCAEQLGIKSVYTVGGSMGAYAAILYGVMLDARILAFAPEITLCIEGSRSASLMKKGVKVLHPDLSQFIAQSKKRISYYGGELDPIDVYCAANIRNSPNVDVAMIPHVGHNPARYIRDIGLLFDLLSSFIKDGSLPALPQNGRALMLEGFPEVFLRSFQAYKRSNWQAVVDLARTSIAMLPTSELSHFHLSYSLRKLGRVAEALPSAALAYTLARKDTERYEDIALNLAGCLRSCEAMGQSRAICLELIETNNENHRAHYLLGLISKEQKNMKDSALHFRKAYQIAPANASYARQLGFFNN